MATEVIYVLPLTGIVTYTNWDSNDETRLGPSCSTSSDLSTTSTSNATLICNMTPIASIDVDVVTSIAIRTYARERYSSSGITTISLYHDGSWDASFGDSQGTSWAYDTSTYNGSWTEAEVNAMQVRVVASGLASTIIDLACLQMTITYTPIVKVHEINDILTSDLSTIGITTIGNIGAWNDITTAYLNKWTRPIGVIT